MPFIAADGSVAGCGARPRGAVDVVGAGMPGLISVLALVAGRGD
jgi:hypothetical protein